MTPHFFIFQIPYNQTIPRRENVEGKILVVFILFRRAEVWRIKPNRRNIEMVMIEMGLFLSFTKNFIIKYKIKYTIANVKLAPSKAIIVN
jgi:hypothetical protein